MESINKSGGSLKWWKWLSGVIMVYVIIGGLTVPLKPGVTKVMPNSAQLGDTIHLDIVSYNTHFTQDNNLKAFLKPDPIHCITSIETSIKDDIHAQFTFVLPTDTLSGGMNPMTLIINSSQDGAFVQPNAVFLQKTLTPKIQTAQWQELPKTFFSSSAFRFPYRNILNETIRNIFFHVALWFAMFILLVAGVVKSIMYLRSGNIDFDIQSSAYTNVAILFGTLGLVTGSVWAKFTWNTFWTNDIKLNMTAVVMLIYLAYLILRGSTVDYDKRAKLSSAYNIFAFVALIPLVFVIPRLTDSLHPGNGGNPALGGEDLDHTLRLFFYPSVIGLTLLGAWMADLLIRYYRLKDKVYLSHESK